MERKSIPFEEFSPRALDLWINKWLLLTCGDFKQGIMNPMTVAWGSLGVMWNKPFAQVVVRPTRHTFTLMKEYDTFTLCSFPEEYKKTLQFMGTKSGRDVDKIKESGLTPIASKNIAAPGFAEANLILECRKIYWDDMEPEHFLDDGIEKKYPKKDYHRIYFGEILEIFEGE